MLKNLIANTSKPFILSQFLLFKCPRHERNYDNQGRRVEGTSYPWHLNQRNQNVPPVKAHIPVHVRPFIFSLVSADYCLIDMLPKKGHHPLDTIDLAWHTSLLIIVCPSLTSLGESSSFCSTIQNRSFRCRHTSWGILLMG